MKSKIYLLPLIIGLAALLGACGNPLWYSGGRGETGLTLNLELPYPETPTANSRALALQGLHIYIEIADIQDETAYGAANLFSQLAEGDGNWVDTGWGGHAVFHATAFGTEAITVNFAGVPTDRDLLIRVIQGLDRNDIESALSAYGEGYPMSQTFVPGGSGPWNDMGVTLSSSSLSTGEIRVPIRPHFNNLSSYFSNPSSLPLVFAEPSGPPANPFQEPPSGETRFTAFSLDMVADTTVNPGMLVGYRIEMTEGFPVPGVVMLYNSDGSRINPSRVHSASSLGTTVISSFSVVPAPPVGQFDFTNYFIGSTLIPGIDLSVIDPNYTSFEVIIRPMINGYFDSYYSDSGLGVIDDHTVRWGWPDTGTNPLLEHGDLEFQVLHWHGTDPVPPNIKDLDAVYQLDPMIIMNWSTAGAYHSPGDGWEYEMLDISALPGVTLNPVDGDNYVTAVLARLPGGAPFLIAAYSSIYNLPFV